MAFVYICISTLFKCGSEYQCVCGSSISGFCLTVKTWVFRINKVFSCFFVLQVQQIDRVVEVVDEAVKGILPQKGTHTRILVLRSLRGL